MGNSSVTGSHLEFVSHWTNEAIRRHILVISELLLVPYQSFNGFYSVFLCLFKMP